jgi:transposase
VTARQTEAAANAIAWAIYSGCTAAAAAKLYGVHVSTVQRGLAAAGKARPRGRPTSTVPVADKA